MCVSPKSRKKDICIYSSLTTVGYATLKIIKVELWKWRIVYSSAASIKSSITLHNDTFAKALVEFGILRFLLAWLLHMEK